MGIIACLIQCFLRCIEAILKVLNHNSIIVMSVTADSYIDSAKSAISLIFNNFRVFVIVEFISDMIGTFGMIICCFIPAFIGGIIVYSGSSSSENAIHSALSVGLLILLLAIFLNNVILQLLQQTLSCIFIFYCFDLKFK